MEELEEILQNIEEFIDEAKSIVYNQEIYIENLEEKIDDEYTLYNINNFKRQLEIQNLLTPQLDEFIDNYMRFSNG